MFILGLFMRALIGAVGTGMAGVLFGCNLYIVLGLTTLNSVILTCA